MTADEIEFDFQRQDRIGLAEAVFCSGKSARQIDAILDMARERDAGLLLTRLDAEKLGGLSVGSREQIDYCATSRTAYFGAVPPVEASGLVAILSAGTSDAPVAREAERTLRHRGQQATFIGDVGVAGLWRLTRRLDEIRAHPVLIVVAGMDAALASVVGGLVSSAVIAVPTSVGYGVATGGTTALHSMLASCAPGVVVCNIDNGYGAASAALRWIESAKRLGG